MEWERRNTVGKDRVDELVEMYRELGYETRVEVFTGTNSDESVCDECLSGGEYYVIYTRKKS